MRVALALAPNDRYVLRSASRLYVHLGDPERAHHLLSRHRRTVSDPWLLAPQIGVADLAGRPSSLMRRGKEMLAHHGAADTTELAGSLATAELEAGQTRKARRLFEQSIEEPNDNALAQAEWANRLVHISDLEIKIESAQGSFEARALEAAAAREPLRALNHALSWLTEEPYSRRAALFGSYEAGKGRDFSTGAAIAERGLIANPASGPLANNLAFCLARLDRIAEAEVALARIPARKLLDGSEPTYTATRGLIAMRAGRIDEGTELYKDAIAAASNTRTRAIALTMFATEILRLNLAEGAEVAELAEQAADDDEARAWLGHLPSRD